jgi:hypothetical protein
VTGFKTGLEGLIKRTLLTQILESQCPSMFTM